MGHLCLASPVFQSVLARSSLLSFGLLEISHPKHKNGLHHPHRHDQLLQERPCLEASFISHVGPARCCPREPTDRCPVNLSSAQGHWLSRQVHRCRRCHRRSRWLRSRNWIRLRLPHHRLRQEPLPQAAAFLIRHLGIRPLRGYGSFLSYDGLPAALRFLNCNLIAVWEWTTTWRWTWCNITKRVPKKLQKPKFILFNETIFILYIHVSVEYHTFSRPTSNHFTFNVSCWRQVRMRAFPWKLHSDKTKLAKYLTDKSFVFTHGSGDLGPNIHSNGRSYFKTHTHTNKSKWHPCSSVCLPLLKLLS